MLIRVTVGFLVAALSLSPPAAVGQLPVEIAFADPQPHFVAAWAPKKAREAERSAVLVQRVSLELTDVPLDLALKTLTNEAGLNITYSPAALPAGKRVTIKAGDIAVVTALTEMLFRSGLDVVVDRDGALALVPCRHPAPRAEVQDSGTIVGTVTDKATGAPIAGATVVVEGTEHSVTTNTEGRYRIAVELGSYTVRVRYIGYVQLSTSVTVGVGEAVTADFGIDKSVQRLDDVVTTGTIVPTEVKALPTPITVITSEDIAKVRPRRMDQLLRQAVPTALAWDNTTVPDATTLSFRGASSFQFGSGSVKVYLDGVEISNRTYATIDPNSIERIEIIRGPQAAAIYGSDAISGVVQVFTKRGDPNTVRPQFGFRGSLGMIQTPYRGAYNRTGTLKQDYSASVRGGTGDASYHVGAGYSRIGEWVPEYSLVVPSAHAGLHLVRGPVTVDLSSRYYTHVYNTPSDLPEVAQSGLAFFTRPRYERVQSKEQTYGARVTYTPLPWWQHNIFAGTDRRALDDHNTQARLTTPGDTFKFVLLRSDAKTSVSYNTSAHLQLTPAITGALATGLDHYTLSTDGFSTSGALTTEGRILNAPGQAADLIREITTNTGWFTQVQVNAKDALFLTGALRAERNSNFGSDRGIPLTSRAGASYVHEFGGLTLKVRASYGEGIRPPPPGRKTGAVNISSIILPNPLLGPERQAGGDAGIDLLVGSHWSMGVTYYNQRAKDLIQQVFLVTTTPVTSQYQNVGRVKNTGLEFEAAARWDYIQVTGQLAISNSRVQDLGSNYSGDLALGDQVLQVPRHTGGVVVHMSPSSGTSMTAGLAYVGKRRYYDWVALFRCFGGTGPCATTSSLRGYHITYPAFVKANLSLTQRLARGLSGFVAVENVTNSHSPEFDNLGPVLGRVTMIGVELGK